MALLKIKAFGIDATDSFTFANANITSNLQAGNANVSGIIKITGNLTSGNANLGNLALANYFSGDGSLLTNISATAAKKIANGTSNVDITSSGGNITIAVSGTGVATFTSTGANISGYANVTGNITAGNVNAGNLLTANYITGTLTTAAQPNITSVGTLTGLTVNGDTTLTGNLIVAGTTTYVNSTVTDIKDPIIELGAGTSGASLTSDDGMDRGSLLHYYAGGSTRDAFMGWKNSAGEFVFASNASTTDNVVTVNAYGNIKAGNANLGNLVTSNYFSGNGSLLTSITGANVSGQVGNALVSGTVYTAAQPNITSVGTLTSLTVTGNISAGNVAGGNLVNANYISGNGSLLTNITGANVTGTVSSATTAGTVTTAAQPNITSVGTLTGLTSGGTLDFTSASNVSLGSNTNVHISGGTTGQYLQTDGSGNLSWASVSSSGLSNGTSNIQVLSSGNITLSSAGTSNVAIITSTGVNVAGTLNSTGNITAGNVSGGNLVSANYISGNGSLLTSITGSNVSGQVGNALVAGTVYTAAQPNITSVGTLTSVAVSGTTNLGAVGNVTITGGSLNSYLKTDGSGSLSWAALPTTTVTVDAFTGDNTTVAFTLSVTPTSKAYTSVTVGGVAQPQSSYTVSGTTLTFSSAPPDTSVIEVRTITSGGSATPVTVTTIGGSAYVGVSANTTMVAGNVYIVNTSSANLTMTLPSSGNLGDSVGIIDGTGNANIHAITVARNGGNIMGSANDMVITTVRAGLTMVYYNSTQGWILTQV